MKLFAHDYDRLLHLAETARQKADFPTVKRLMKEADDALLLKRISVTDNPGLPASGNKHDYYSISPYAWPNPDTPDGLPYIYRDGEFNPDFELCDRRRMDKICQVTRTLTLAYLFSGETKYREHAIHLLRCFFIDEETHMNPHMEYAQAVKGVCTGRGIGIIDIRYFYRFLDMITILNDEELNNELRPWMKEMLNWLLNSQKGQDEKARVNNHGTWYDVTCASIALFTKQEDIARDILKDFGQRRIHPQVQADGSQPKELARTRSYLYSNMNLYAFCIGAYMASNIGIDVWDCEAIHRAFLYMLPSYEDYSTWAYEQIAENWEQTWEQIFEVLVMMADLTGVERYRMLAKTIFDERIPDSDVVLLRG